jgi:flagellar hook-length control protein FliK
MSVASALSLIPLPSAKPARERDASPNAARPADFEALVPRDSRRPARETREAGRLERASDHARATPREESEPRREAAGRADGDRRTGTKDRQAGQLDRAEPSEAAEKDGDAARAAPATDEELAGKDAAAKHATEAATVEEATPVDVVGASNEAGPVVAPPPGEIGAPTAPLPMAVGQTSAPPTGLPVSMPGGADAGLQNAGDAMAAGAPAIISAIGATSRLPASEMPVVAGWGTGSVEQAAGDPTAGATTQGGAQANAAGAAQGAPGASSAASSFAAIMSELAAEAVPTDAGAQAGRSEIGRSETGLPQSLAGTGAPAAGAQAPEAPRSQATVQAPLALVPIEIGLKAAAGLNRFEIRLDPEELGRIDVRLDLGDDGSVSAKLVVDRVETLALLQRDARTLERAFEQIGLKTSGEGIAMTLRDPGFEQRERQDQTPAAARATFERQSESTTQQAAQPDSTILQRWWRPGGVDLRI